jgi:Bacterial extracellular solute-binding protein, family 7
VYSRADLSRIGTLVVGLLLAAISTGAFAREFWAADTQSEDYPTVQALRYMGRLFSFEPYGFVGLTFYDSGARSIYNSVRPVRSIADLRGLRLRVQQSEMMSEMIRALDAEPIELPYGQVLTGLATKLIDGGEQLAVVRHHGSLQICRLLHPDRTHDEPRSAGDVA